MYDDMLTLDGAPHRARIDGDIITGTLNTLNSGSAYHGSGKSAQSASYDFQQDVLSSYYSEKGLGAIVYTTA